MAEPTVEADVPGQTLRPVTVRYLSLLWGYASFAVFLTSIALFFLPDKFVGGLPKPLRGWRNRLLHYWRRARELSVEGPFFRLLVWSGRKVGNGKLASAPQAPGLRVATTGCNEMLVTLTPSLPRNPFHEENYIVAWCKTDGKEEWRERSYHKDFDLEKVGTTKLKTHLDQLPERAAVQVRACSHNAWGRSPWSRVASAETYVQPSDEGGLTGPLAASGGSAGQYTWTQTRTEVFVKIPVSASVKARDIRFKCTGPKLEVRLLEEGGGEPSDILVGPLFKKVKADEVFWTIENEDKKLGRHLSVQLVKVEALEKWPCVIDADGHPRVDVKLIRFFTGEPENMSDLSALNLR